VSERAAARNAVDNRISDGMPLRESRPPQRLLQIVAAVYDRRDDYQSRSPSSHHTTLPLYRKIAPMSS
jgi:hypothetical protein